MQLSIESEAQLDDLLTTPDPALIDFLRTVTGPLVVLGAGGKMGPTLCVLARRASEAVGRPLDVIAVSRFSDTRSRDWLESRHIHTISADLLADDPGPLPFASHVVFLVGLKFGTSADASRTWATNTLAPAAAARFYRGVPMAALSTGNVYPLSPVARGGSVETDPLEPLGEYANAAVARERLLEHFSRRDGTPMTILRLNYAVELRYGVLVDISRKVLLGEPVDLASGHLNCIWQGDASSMILRSLALASSPPRVLNLTGTEVLAVRDLAIRLGKLLGREPVLRGSESPTALLSSASPAAALLGPPPTPLDDVLRWTARWVEQGGRILGRPTHFEVRDGRY